MNKSEIKLLGRLKPLNYVLIIILWFEKPNAPTE